MIDVVTPIKALIAQLQAVPGIAGAGMDPAAVPLPGVWVQLGPIIPHTLTTRLVGLRLALLAGDTDGGLEATAQLQALLAAVETVANADGPITPRSYLLPHTPSPMPGLEFPLNIYAQES